MGRQDNAAPVIIKRKKIVAGDGHHGGAWKVAYADFVTAMMAFFLLMWLLNATTENQRKGLADYFSPSIPVNRISGGGDGAFGGENVFSEDTIAQSGRGGSNRAPDREQQARGASGVAADQPEAAAQDPLRDIESLLLGRAGESAVSDLAARHILTRITDDGLIVELFDVPGVPLFDAETAQPTATLELLAPLLAEVFALVTNGIAIEGHSRSFPVVLAENPVWDVTTARGQRLREMLEAGGIEPARLRRVTGHADRQPVTSNVTAVRNNRIEVILLRETR
jgi:chemotaxis protein MotB